MNAEGEELYRAMFEKNRVAKLLVDPRTGELVDVNPAAAAFYGRTREQLCTFTLPQLSTQPQAHTMEMLRRAELGREDFFHSRHRLGSGAEKEVEIHAGKLALNNRALLYCMVLDVSEQVRATQSMQRSNEALEARVEERTQELQQRIAEVEELNSNMVHLLEDLKSAHLEAENAACESKAANLRLQLMNQELEAFSYSVSHDLRAPLRHIAGYASILKESQHDKLDAEGHRHLNTISSATRRMDELINDLLAFSRIGRAQLSVRNVSLSSLASDVARELRAEAGTRDVVWRLHELPEVQADPSLLRQVFMNLVGNALKYTRPRPRAVIEIGASLDSSGAQEHTLFVRDNGVGFDMAYANKLFGVFQRLHSATEFEGTGIGLAHVRRIISRHGGRTWADSATDRGATFYFTLPKKDPPPVPEPLKAFPAPPPSESINR